MKITRIKYRNWKGVVSYRTIQPQKLEYTSTEWHQEPGWILYALDLDKGDQRGFAMKDIMSWEELEDRP